MPIEVRDGKAMWWWAGGVYLDADKMRQIADMVDKENAELRAKQIEEVFRSDYVTVFRRADGKEAAVVCDGDYGWWASTANSNGYSRGTRIKAETAARESLMNADVKTEKEVK